MPKPKTKGGKDSTENDSKKTKNKKNAPSEEFETNDVKDEMTSAPSNDITHNSVSEILKPEIDVIQAPEELIEIKYEEPILTGVLVESYEGEKEKGLFHGYGKVIYRGGNIYEGEFVNGMMSGKGKYIWTNRIIYEGDFINNEIIGSGVYRWFNEDDTSLCSIYDGEVFKGKRHGIGTFKCAKSPVIYAGEWNMGRVYGKGKMIYDEEGLSYYEGDWINDKKFGWGVRHYLSGNIYEGMWVNDVRHGEGTMRWFDKNQIYTGQWENGLPNGLGEHNWYLARIEMTQYSLRNTYYGSFKNGKRHGKGTFLYADGSKYEGSWENNLKHGWGKYTSKDMTVYEGYFEDDKMTDSPTYKRTSKLSNEISKIKTRIPSAGTTLNIHMLRANQDVNRGDFSLKLEINSILKDFDENHRNLELTQAHKTIIRYLDLFKQIYRFYSQLGFDSSPDNTFVLNRMQFWRFLKDCKINLNDEYFTLMDFDRLLNPNINVNDLHCPYDKILIREFFNYIVLTAYHLYKNDFNSNGLKLASCIEKLIEEKILPYSCNVGGYFYADARKTLNVITYMVKSYEIYCMLSTKRNKYPYDRSITMRNFMNALNDYKLIDGKFLSSKNIVDILSTDNPIVYDSEGAYNLELEITFLEFFEALIGCAITYNSNLSALSSTISFKNKSAATLHTQINQPVTIGQEPITTASRPPSKSQYVNSHETKTTDHIAQADAKTETNENFVCKSVEIGNNQETNLVEIIEDREDLDDSMKNWINVNQSFFVDKFFPAAEKHTLLRQIINRSL